MKQSNSDCSNMQIDPISRGVRLSGCESDELVTIQGPILQSTMTICADGFCVCISGCWEAQATRGQIVFRREPHPDSFKVTIFL